MERFSDRIGATNPKNEIQIESMDDDLKNSLWNVIYDWVENNKQGQWIKFVKWANKEYFKRKTHEVAGYNVYCRDEFSEEFSSLPWYEVYNFLETLIDSTKALLLENNINKILEREMSGYRIINYSIVPISDRAEVDAINETLKLTSSTDKIKTIHTHIKTALEKLSLKPTPDYRNSIKESISAVEGVCKLLTGENSGGLNTALKKLTKKANINSQLEEAYLKLYAFTNGKDGIRHPILDEPNIGYDEAKYMLVSCSAFVNFIIGKASKNGLLIK